MKKISAALIAVGICLPASTTSAQPQYNIISLGQLGEFASGGQGVSNSGNFAAGFTVSTEDDALIWSDISGSSVLPDEPTRPYSKPWSVNDAGTVVGIGATTFFGSGALPVIWKNGTATALPLPSGETLGRAYSVNNSEFAVGSVGGGSLERAATFTESAGTQLAATMPDGGILTTAYGVNNAGRIVGQALDPDNAAVTRAFYLDPGDTNATDLEALPGQNSAIAFAVSSNGLIAGSSSINGGADGMPFLWSESDGMTPIPLPAGTSTASSRGVNADGWVVGTGGGVFAVPFLYDGTGTYRLQDLIPSASGWDLSTNTSSGAFGIANESTIVGRGLLNGEVTGFVLTLVPALCDLDGDGDCDTADLRVLYDEIESGDASNSDIGDWLTEAGDLNGKVYLPGDTNLDGSVLGNDFTKLAANFGNSSTGLPPAYWDNGNFDGDVDGFTILGPDFTQLAANFGHVSVVTVPEANSVGLLLLGVLSLCFRGKIILRKGKSVS